MGAFYGSVQVRSDDRDRVKAVAEEVARALEIRMLVGPVLGGWIGVYPEGSGQDKRVSREMAGRIKHDLLHFLVHDEDIFAYWLYRDGTLIDSFHSRPGYFGNENRAEEEAMVGDAEAFRPLIRDRVDELVRLLVREERLTPFESGRLESFAKILGISNALTSYEYLKEDDHQGIKGWRKFEEVPADQIVNAKERKRREKEFLKSEIKRLKAEGLLLRRELCRDEMPFACASPRGLLVGWLNPRQRATTFEEFRPPWTKPVPISLSAAPSVSSTAADSSGRRIAMAARDRVQVWDATPTDWNHVCDVLAPDGVSAVALSGDGKLVAHSSRSGIVLTEVSAARRLFAVSNHGFAKAAFHPSGDWLAVAQPMPGLIAIREEPHWRQLGGKPNLVAVWEAASESKMTQANFDAIIAKTRAFSEMIIGRFRRTNQSVDDPQVLADRIESKRSESESSIEKMQSQWAAWKQKGGSPPPRAMHQVDCVGFSRDGRWFWCGTSRGLRVYEWATVGREEEAEMPEPTWSFELPESELPVAFRMVHAIEEERDRPAVVFGGVTGRLYRLDLTSGETTKLVKLPGDCHIHQLTLSIDGSALAITAKATPLARGAEYYLEEGTIWEVWNYGGLRDEGHSSNQP